MKSPVAARAGGHALPVFDPLRGDRVGRAPGRVGS